MHRFGAAPGPRLAILIMATTLLGCPDSTKVASECVQADFISACPVGSNPKLDADATSVCGGKFSGNLIEEAGSASGQCTSAGNCEILCQFEVPCSCGVATITKESIVCSECPAQSCGDSRCEGTERPSCEPGQQGCQPCIEDCAGPSCGDGDCTGSENPTTCPQDCAQECVPNAQECIGNILRKCSADGRSSVSIDCSDSGFVCQPSSAQCVPSGACGNEVCDTSETPGTCPQDCAGLCQPNQVRCESQTLVRCAADGASESRVDCGASNQVCGEGACRTPNQCGNFVCEAGEDVASCAQDCEVVCGNERCDPGEDVASCPLDCAVCGNNACEGEEAITCRRDCPVCGNGTCELFEENTCPADCTTCGNAVCEASELETCPQDCGVCTPNSRECLGDLLRVCTANGVAFEDVDCGTFEQVCAKGGCVVPNQCGNGACETGEDETSCAGDCREVCGNGLCGVGEDFGTCSIDCPPVCGDGSCNGDERPGTCALDCVATCNNDLCDGVEDRDNCPNDCGFCGNGICEDGAESPKVTPPGNLESCLVDCVVSVCQNNADCDDEQACTTNSCVDGTCAYQPSDALCPVNQKCIKFNGCCPDKDRDGYADEACGGSDCNDDDADIHPGALEVCGGGDRNCNGVHKPTLRPAKKVTDTFSLKMAFDVSQGSSGYLASWTGTPETAHVIEYARITATGALIGAIRTVPGKIADLSHSVYSPVRNAFGLMYQRQPDNWIELNFVEPDGDLELTSPIEVGFACPRTSMAWLNNTFFIPSFSACSTWYAVSEAGGVTATGLNHAETANIVVGGGRLNVLASRNTVYKLDPANAANVVSVLLQGDHSANANVARLGWDGNLLIWAVRDATGVHYERFFPNGFIESTAAITTTLLDPIDTAYAPAANGDPARVGVLMSEGTSNLYLFVRNEDGSEALPLGLVAGGSDVVSPHIFWDGTQFVVFWLAKVNQIHQVFTTTVSCE